jgi:hypothetical protein
MQQPAERPSPSSGSRASAALAPCNTAIDFDFDAAYGEFKMSGTGRELGGTEGTISFTEPLTVGI